MFLWVECHIRIFADLRQNRLFSVGDKNTVLQNDRFDLSGTGDSQRFARIDSRESFATETPIFIACQADSHKSLDFPIRANRGGIDSRESRH